jgi:hypothetical protein
MSVVIVFYKKNAQRKKNKICLARERILKNVNKPFPSAAIAMHVEQRDNRTGCKSAKDWNVFNLNKLKLIVEYKVVSLNFSPPSCGLNPIQHLTFAA